MPICKDLLRLKKASLRPPALVSADASGEEEIPWVLLEAQAYVTDLRNGTTAIADSTCGAEIQVSFVLARPPEVSCLCVFCRRHPAATGEDSRNEGEEGMIPIEPQVMATDENLVLLRIVVSPEKDLAKGADLYVYRPAGDGGPSLARLPRPRCGYTFNSYQVGLLSCPANRRDELDGASGGLSLLRPHHAPEDKFHMVAALCDDWSAPGCGRFVLCLFNSKLGSWTTTNVSVEDRQFDKYQDEGFFLHQHSKVIAIGGEDVTIGFVDLWRGILLCNLSHVKEKPLLHYIPLPHRADTPRMEDARLSRDIAVVKGHFKFVHQQLHRRKACPTCGCNCMDAHIQDGWKSDVWTMPVSASSLLGDTYWEPVCSMESFEMDIKGSRDFQLLPKLEDNEGRPLGPFQRLTIWQPTLSLDKDQIVCFMAKMNHDDVGDKAWAITVDMENKRLQEVANFDASRYIATGFAYLHIRVYQGTKGNLKRRGRILLPGSSNKKLTWVGGEQKQQDAEMEAVAEAGGADMLLG